MDGGKPVQLTDFKSDNIFSFDWSRDGKFLALSRGSTINDVVLISDFKQPYFITCSRREHGVG